MKTILILALTATAWAQDAKYYRLDFSVKEVEDNRTLSAKRYSTIGSTASQARQGQVRAGTRVPAANGQYYEVGVNIDCVGLREAGPHLHMVVISEVSSIPVIEGAPTTALPVVRQNRWTAEVTVEVGKPTVLFSSDDLNSKRKLQLELTATPIK
jgi:hypothetical protein